MAPCSMNFNFEILFIFQLNLNQFTNHSTFYWNQTLLALHLDFLLIAMCLSKLNFFNDDLTQIFIKELSITSC